MLQLQSQNEFADLVGAGGKLLVGFGTKWCGPCRMMEMVLDKIGTENPDIVVAKGDIDDVNEFAAAFSITNIPYAIAFVDGKIVKEFTGAKPAHTYMAAFE